MKYRAYFFEDPISCVDDAVFEADSKEDLLKQMQKYVDEHLIPMGYEVAGANYNEIKD